MYSPMRSFSFCFYFTANVGKKIVSTNIWQLFLKKKLFALTICYYNKVKLKQESTVS